MLDHMFDYGFPLIHNKYALQCMIRPEGTIDKIEKTIIGRSQKNKSDIEPLKKYIDNLSDIKPYTKWRIPNLNVSNEILFDVVEYMDCVLDEKGNVIQQEINGDIKVEGNLSGVPNIILYMNIPQEFDDFSVHQCLYGKTFSLLNEKVLNFIVPSGNFTLLSYNYYFISLRNIQPRYPFDFFIHKDYSQVNSLAKFNYVQRIKCLYLYDLSRNQLEDFHIKFIYSQDVKIKSSSQTFGIYSQNNNTHKALWRLGTLNPESKTQLNLEFEAPSKEDMKEASIVICVKFCVPTLSFSGTRIEKAVFKNKDYKVSKKARCVAKSGYFEIRA